MPEFVRLLPLPPERADMAYPLAQAADPTLTVPGWRRIVRRRCAVPDGRNGIVVAQTPRGYFQGLFTYRVRGGRPGRRVLAVDRFSVLGLVGNAAAAALLAEMDRLAARHGCATIAIALGEAAPGLVGQLPEPFRALGHRVCGLALERAAR